MGVAGDGRDPGARRDNSRNANRQQAERTTAQN